MNIAVIGGTGFVGAHVVDSLTAAGHQVSLLLRPGSEHKVRSENVWRSTSGDLDDHNALDATLSGCDAVIYSVGLLREFPNRGITFEKTQYEGVVSVVESAKRSGVTRFLLISANGVKVPGTKYQETKKRAEEFLLASGLEATIFQPSVIFGDPRGTMEFATQLYQDMVASPLPAVGFFVGSQPKTGQIMMSPAYIGDVAQAIVNALSNPSTVGQTYAIGGPEALSWNDMIMRIAATVKRRKLIVPMPIGVMKMAATMLDWLPAFPVTRDQLTMLAENNVADPADLRKLADRELTAFNVDSLAYLKQENPS